MDYDTKLDKVMAVVLAGFMCVILLPLMFMLAVFAWWAASKTACEMLHWCL